MKEGNRTPWGKADHVEEERPGVWQVSTSGHGGYKLDRAHNAKVHAAWRNAGGWYEEDCDWARVVLTFPEHYTAQQLGDAHQTAKQYTPDEYTIVIGQPVGLGESWVLRQRAFAAANADKYVAVTAWGVWHAAVPEGFVGVWATLAGTRVGIRVGSEWKAPLGKYFLVSEAEYAEKAEFGFVIDETKHQTWAGEKATAKEVDVRTILAGSTP